MMFDDSKVFKVSVDVDIDVDVLRSLVLWSDPAEWQVY